MKSISIRRGLLAVTLLVLANACSSPDEPAEERVLAEVGQASITVARFEQEMAVRAPMRPGYFDRVESRRELLDGLIRHQAQVNAAHEAGIADDPEFRELVERMMIQRLRDQRLRAELDEDEIEHAELAAYYEANPTEFGRPERRQIAMIRINRPARADDAQLAELKTIAEQARAAAHALPTSTPHFGAVAVEYSNDRSSRYQGGVVGWLVDHPDQTYRWPDVVLSAAFELTEPGSISPVIESEDGFWLLRLVALQPASRQPLETVAEGIRHRLTRQRAADLETGMLDQILAGQTIRINEAELAAIAAPVSTLPERPINEAPPRPPALPGADFGTAERTSEHLSDHE